MHDFGEYKYNTTHFTEKQAFDEYRGAKIRYPNSIVTLEKLDCGHWTVKVYSSVREKEALMRKKLDDYMGSYGPHPH